MYNEPVLFDDHPRGSDSQGLREIADALEERGIDAPSALYDEALELANEGHLGQARDRLRMLLCLDPHDGQAHLLLSKVMVAQGRFADALSQLDQAAACGVRAPQELRDQIEAGRQGELGDSQGERVAARANVELKTLREEARRLRSENAYLEQLTWDLTRKVRRWTATSAVIALTGTLLVGVTLFAGSGGAAATPEATTLAAAVDAEAAAAAAGGVAAVDGAAAPSAPVAPKGRSYVVQKGDTLGKVAQDVYGQASRWTDIRDANKAALKGGIALKVGQELVIPE